MRQRYLFFTMVLFFGISSTNAELVGEFSLFIDAGTRTAGEELQIFWRDRADDGYTATCLYWDNIPKTGSGMTFRVDENTENFQYFVDRLTSGTNQELAVWEKLLPGYGGSHGFIYYEQEWFTVYGHKYVQNNSPDLYGAQIAYIDMHVNSILFNSPGQNPNGDGLWTDYTCDLTFYIHSIPEPGTAMLLGLGALALRRKQ